MWLAWDIAVGVSLVLLVAWGVLRSIEGRSARVAKPFAGELSLMFGLYAIWQLAGRISVIDKEGAFRRAYQIWDFQRFLHLPNEATLQVWLLPYGWLIQAANIYYATVHVPAMIICLAWLFIRFREEYRKTRTNLALLTGTSLLIQLLAVAPPRFLEDIGMIDTAVFYNQSVFSSLGFESAGQLQAMPSLHVGWAFLVGVVTWTMATGWVRWVGPVHAVLTFLVVAITANHYWLDGIVAGLILAVIMWMQQIVGHTNDDHPSPRTDLSEGTSYGSLGKARER